MHSKLDTSSYQGVACLFRFAIEARKNDADLTSLRHLEKRFGLEPYEPKRRGTLEDYVKDLDALTANQRFRAVFDMISNLLSDDDKLDDRVAEQLINISSDHRIVRFSFPPSLLVCLTHANEMQSAKVVRYHGYEIRYAGLGTDRELMAFASLFLGLAIYTETGTPWSPDSVFDDGEPNTEPADIEISFPPAKFNRNEAPHLEGTLRASKLPRAVDRGKYDIESVMLDYLCSTNNKAIVFVSEAFLTSTKQSRLLTRQYLIRSARIHQVLELTWMEPSTFMIRLEANRTNTDQVHIASTRNSLYIGRDALLIHECRGSNLFVSFDEIRRAGDSLRPSRYLESGPAGGPNFRIEMVNAQLPTKYRLADLFEVIRPKTTRNDQVGTFALHEVRAGNISHNGEITGNYNTVNVRDTQVSRLEQQLIKPGDILFAHRGPIGRTAYVTKDDLINGELWAGQTLLIFRSRRKNSQDLEHNYCDPRVLFMYLLTPEVKWSWQDLSIDSRSPAIPIGQIEGFGLPSNIITYSKHKANHERDILQLKSEYINAILKEFEERQENLSKLSKMQKHIYSGLDKVWKLAWNEDTGYDYDDENDADYLD